MQCPGYQHENGPNAKFCEECGTALARRCASCGTSLSPTAKFCPECGHPAGGAATESRSPTPESYTPEHLTARILTSKSALEGERKQVTALFADLKGSMEVLPPRSANGWAQGVLVPQPLPSRLPSRIVRRRFLE